jgi:hypothetical protein
MDKPPPAPPPPRRSAAPLPPALAIVARILPRDLIDRVLG